MTNEIQGATKRSIQLSAQPDSYPLGGMIPIHVRYQNRSQTTISFREPQKTWSVQMAVGRPNAAPVEVAFGRIGGGTKGGVTRWTVERAETITLGPGATYEFDYDAGQRWPDQFAPGFHVLQIKDMSDDSETVLSNQVDIRVVYDQSTFPALLALASADKATLDVRAFAAKWIAALFPDFHLSPAPDPAHAAAEKEQFAKARAWWSAHGNEPGVGRQISRLNSDAASVPR